MHILDQHIAGEDQAVPGPRRQEGGIVGQSERGGMTARQGPQTFADEIEFPAPAHQIKTRLCGPDARICPAPR